MTGEPNLGGETMLSWSVISHYCTSKTCKGYHFWCPNAAVSIFDRMFRVALDRVRAQGNITPVHDVSGIALGFRSVFGHMI